jgi:K(+)-stimulated pyrophosphate-energized sodium pump
MSILHPPFLLGLIVGGSRIYRFTGAATQAVSTGAWAVEFIKANIKLDAGRRRSSVADSKKVVAICTHAQKGMLNTLPDGVFSTLAFAFFEPFFFIGTSSLSLFGLPGTMANARRGTTPRRLSKSS